MVSSPAIMTGTGPAAGRFRLPPLNGTFVVGLQPGTDRREFLRRALERHRIDAFSQKEPELEEIYIDAVKSAGIEDRVIE